MMRLNSAASRLSYFALATGVKCTGRGQYPSSSFPAIPADIEAANQSILFHYAGSNFIQ
jgi:hypothetical protein